MLTWTAKGNGGNSSMFDWASLNLLTFISLISECIHFHFPNLPTFISLNRKRPAVAGPETRSTVGASRPRWLPTLKRVPTTVRVSISQCGRQHSHPLWFFYVKDSHLRVTFTRTSYTDHYEGPDWVISKSWAQSSKKVWQGVFLSNCFRKKYEKIFKLALGVQDRCCTHSL